MLLGPWRLPQAEMPSPPGKSCCQELEVPGDRRAEDQSGKESPGGQVANAAYT